MKKLFLLLLAVFAVSVSAVDQVQVKGTVIGEEDG